MSRVTEPRKRTITEEIVTAINCDRCGKNVISGEWDREGASFTLRFGYGSRFDDEEWQFDLCDDCAEHLRAENSHSLPEKP